MKYISVRNLVVDKKLGEFSTGVRPLTYATLLRRVVDHIEKGNAAKFISIGDGRSVRYAITEDNIPTFISSLTKYYSR